MKLPDCVVDKAFQLHIEAYPNWTLSERAGMWEMGRSAFGPQGSRVDFDRLFSGLVRWQAFRGQTPPDKDWVCREIVSPLTSNHPNLKNIVLAELTEHHLPSLRPALKIAGRIKRLKHGQSLVALSKSLHFWNPGLFVIFDRQEMEERALTPPCVQSSIRQKQAEIASRYGLPDPIDEPKAGHFFYSSILLWAADLLRANPYVIIKYADYIQQRWQADRVLSAAGPLPERYKRYAGFAVEVLLLGMYRIPDICARLSRPCLPDPDDSHDHR